jgi:aminoglycoside phosphotransferase
MSTLDPTAALDPLALITMVEAATGERLELLGTAAVGEVGAAFVRRADHSEAVLSGGPDARALRRAAEGLELAREAGLPVPRYLEVVEHGQTVALLQERLPGRPPSRVDDHLVKQLLDFVDKLKDLLPSSVGPGATDLHLVSSGLGYCLHGSLAAYDARTRELLRWVRSVGSEHGTLLPGSDLVHLDLHPANVLVDPTGTITGVVDWDAAGRGDARLAWVTLLFDLAWGTAFDSRYGRLESRTMRRLDKQIATLDPGLLRQCWAHMSLRQVDWSLRHHGRELVEHQLQVALDGRRRYRLG